MFSIRLLHANVEVSRRAGGFDGKPPNVPAVGLTDWLAILFMFFLWGHNRGIIPPNSLQHNTNFRQVDDNNWYYVPRLPRLPQITALSPSYH